MKNSDFKLINNIKLISIYIFNKESSIKAINKIYSAIDKYKLKTELIKVTSISFSLAVEENEATDRFINSLEEFSDIKIRNNLSVLHITNNSFTSDLLSEMFSRLNEDELRMIHYRLGSGRVTLISDKPSLDSVIRKIQS